MVVIASLVGFAAGFVTWFIGSYFIALFINWGSNRKPPVSESALKAYEIILCGVWFVVSVGVLYIVTRAMWPQD